MLNMPYPNGKMGSNVCEYSVLVLNMQGIVYTAPHSSNKKQVKWKVVCNEYISIGLKF